MSETKPADLEQWLESALAKARAEERELCARIAENACLVPPDGGAPTLEEVAVARSAADQIRALDERTEK